MQVELIQASYPEMELFPEIESLSDIKDENPEDRERREEAHLEAYEKAQAEHIKTYERREKFVINESCRLEGCQNTPKSGLKFCGQHMGIRHLIPKKVYKDLGPGTKVRISK